MALERNGDLHPMLAERPLMRHWEMLRHGFPRSLLVNGVDCSVKTAFYHVSKLFADNRIDTYVTSAVRDFEGEQKVFTTLGYDSRSGEYVLKLINLLGKPVLLEPDLEGFDRFLATKRCVLSLQPGVNNTPEHPHAVEPAYDEPRLDLTQRLEIAPYSLTVYRFK